MPSQSLQPRTSTSTKRTRAEWDTFIRERESLDAQRRTLNRQADLVKKQIDAMDAEIAALVESETLGMRERQVTLKNFILSFMWVKPFAITLAFAAYRKLSPDEKTDLETEVGEARRLDIQWRTAKPPDAA